MRKILLYTALLLAAFFTSFENHALASELDNSEDLKKQVTDLFKDTDGINIIDINEVPKDTPIIEFDSIEEFEKSARAFQENIKNEIDNNEIFEISDQNLIKYNSNISPMSQLRTNKVGRIKWHTAERWDYVYKLYMPSSMTIDLSFQTTGKGSTERISKINSIKSHSSGIKSSWTQTNSASNISKNNLSVSITIIGYHTVGISIKGFTLGANFDDSWTKTYKL